MRPPPKGTSVDTRSCVSAKKEAFTYNPATGHWKDEASNTCIGTGNCASSTGLCLVPCGDASGVWSWDAADGSVRARRDDASNACLQTASKVLDANVFVGECSSPLTAQQKWKNASMPQAMQMYGGAAAAHDFGSEICHTTLGDDCSGCKDKECCDSYFVPGPDLSKYNCAWSTSANACSTSPTPCSADHRGYAGLCVRANTGGVGVCLRIDSDGAWAMMGGGAASGNVSYDPATTWTHLKIIATGTNLTAVVNGVAYPAGPAAAAAATNGMVSINSGFNVAYFDNFSIVAF